MPNPDHLAILQQGVDTWNQWRKDNPDIHPDLSETNLGSADLSKANLIVTDLSGSELVGATLIEAELKRAILSGTDLSWAKLSKADLISADLSEANLARADFKGANLSRADLSGADFTGANLTGANLDAAIVSFTNFIYIDLTMVKGLDTINHNGHSFVDIHTLYLSKGQIPEVFLRGIGAPDSFIAYARSLALAEQPIQYYSCFISYSDKNRDFANRLYADLQAAGVRCWFAPHDLPPGEVVLRGIDQAIHLQDKTVLILSAEALASQWVEHEVSIARDRELRENRTILYPLRLDNTILETPAPWAVGLRARHIADFDGWQHHATYQTAFTHFLRHLKSASP